MKSSKLDREPRLKFDWPIYADATLAGLSVLIPIPLVDLLFETIFERRMLGSIAKRNGRTVSPEVATLLNRSQGCWPGCLMWPFELILEFAKRLFRTVLYFLTIKATSDKLSYQWHRAFLFDFMMRRGDLDSPEQATTASLALQETLKGSNTSPLMQLAQQVTKGFRHVLRTAWNFMRRNKEDEVVINAREEMASSWSGFEEYLKQVASDYEEAYERLESKEVEEIIVLTEEEDDTTFSR